MGNSVCSVIAIDGPSGSGKSSLAKALAKNFNLLYVDTGAMFRSIAFWADREKLSFEEGEDLKEFLQSLDIQYGESETCLIKINGQNLTKSIRDHRVSRLSSIVSQLPSVRDYLLDFQRSLVQNRVCVMEGRDIGTVVFPDSFCKFFVIASVKIRAQRRLNQLEEEGEVNVTLEQLIKDQQKRDESDMSREYAPLKQSKNSKLIDSGKKDFEEVLKEMGEFVQKRSKEVGIIL